MDRAGRGRIVSKRYVQRAYAPYPLPGFLPALRKNAVQLAGRRRADSKGNVQRASNSLLHLRSVSRSDALQRTGEGRANSKGGAQWARTPCPLRSDLPRKRSNALDRAGEGRTDSEGDMQRAHAPYPLLLLP